MSQLNTGTKPSKYATTTRATLEAIAAERDELKKQNKALREELEDARENLGKGEKWRKDRIEGLEKSEATLDKLCFKRKIEILKYKKALEEVENIAFKIMGDMWKEDSMKIQQTAKEALNET